MGGIADFRDPLAGNPYRSPRVRRLDAILERLFFRHADAAVANTDTVAEIWRSRYPQWRQKFEVLWNGFDPELAPRARAIPPRPCRVMVHVGSLCGDRYPTLLIDSLGRLIAAEKLRPDDVLVRLIGPFSEPRNDDAGRPWLSFTGERIPQEEARRLASEADYLLLLDLTTQPVEGPAGLHVPSKLFEYVTIGRPVLACTTRNSPVARILERSGIPHCCLYPDASPDDNDARLLRFLAVPSDPATPSEWFKETFDAASQTQQLEAIIRRAQESARAAKPMP